MHSVLGGLRRKGPDRRDAGMATVELAAALPVLVLLLAVGLGVIDAARLRISSLDAAREGARVAARADDAAGLAAARRAAPPGSVVVISRSAGMVTVEVSTRAAILGARLSQVTVTASATAMVEPRPESASSARSSPLRAVRGAGPEPP